MPLPRTFSSDKRRTPLHPVAEEDEFENEDDDILSMFEKKTPIARPKSASVENNLPTSKSNTTTMSSSKQLDSMILDQLKGLNNDVQQILDKQQQLSAAQTDLIDGKLEDHQTSIMSRISTSQSEVAALCRGIAQLKDWVESTQNHSGNLSESIESLVTSVAKHNEDLVDLTAMKAQQTSSREQKESLNGLKKESNENRSLLEEMWASYEKDSMLLRKEQEALLVEKEKLLQDRILLENAEALFEQRKLAAKDSIEYADQMMRTMKETEAKVSSEMERLAQLSEYVAQKNSEAEEKLAEAQRLSDELRDWQGVIGSEHDAAVRLKQEVEDDRMKLSRDRLSLLKSKPSNLPRNPLQRSTKVNLMNDFSLTKSVHIRHRLSS
eukprot:CAMPEP_0201742346 /NCGR_PEP_ID=MMETSP0593-20130828/47273_1 /ASSEMBLY_ACC=CAM_ASM_000672 /TAXON_ID=267983 /ORGANISM="Skeletonema japonicum, Strain CCMP2506" /LENGTH=380 /DNA_ID=CAMNT_0048236695 /DNA_START=909 /DNA_END=2047 /DNA_ORIENTATION=+